MYKDIPVMNAKPVFITVCVCKDLKQIKHVSKSKRSFHVGCIETSLEFE